MDKPQIDDLLVEWECARQGGNDLSAEELCKDAPELVEELETRIQVLKKTTWMLEDPVSKAPSQEVQDSLSRFLPSDSDATRPASLHSPELASSPRVENLGIADLHSSLQDRLQRLRSELSDEGFELLNELGRGGFGVVYRARDVRLAREVAIKVPLMLHRRSKSADHDALNEQQTKRYLREARNAALVEAQGLVPVLQVGETKSGTCFVVQKLIDGNSLAERLHQQGRLPEEELRRLMDRICAAMAQAHERGMVHRDLKPANILIDRHGDPWITDFGMAFTEHDIQADPKLRTHIGGTLGYMAPEQIDGKVERLDGRTDIWALGVILYQCLTGRMPFRGVDEAETIEQIRTHDPRPIAQVAPNLDEYYDQIFRKCCAKQVSERYASASHLQRELQRTGSGQVASVARRALRPAATAIGTVLIVCLAWWSYVNWRSGADASGMSGKSVEEIESVESAIFAAAKNLSDHDRELEIEIPAGVYRESVQIDGNVILRGAADRAQVVIEGTGGPAFIVRRGATLRLIGLTIKQDRHPSLESEQSPDLERAPDSELSLNSELNSKSDFNPQSGAEPFNAIVVQGGRLVMEDCRVESSGYDCVKLEADSEFSGHELQLISSVQPAIYGKKVREFELSNSRVEFALAESMADEAAAVGIQLRETSGKITGCIFSGNKATGIEWGDTETNISIEDCQFDRLQVGIVGFGCSQIEIAGLEGCQFTGCETAIQLAACSGLVAAAQVDGLALKSSVGIQVLANRRPGNRDLLASSLTSIAIEESEIQRTQAALVVQRGEVAVVGLQVPNCLGSAITLLSNSHLTLSGSTEIRNCRDFGLRLENSSAVLTRTLFERCQVSAVALDASRDSLRVVSGRIADCPLGLWLASGSATLEDTEIHDCDTGVLFSRKSEVGHVATGDEPLQLFAERGKCSARLRTIQFLSPGECRLQSFELSSPSGGDIQVAETLRLSEEGEITRVIEK